MLPLYRGKRGHPVIFRATLYEDFLRLAGGWRKAGGLGHPRDIQEVPTEEEGVILNLNDPETLKKAATPRTPDLTWALLAFESPFRDFLEDRGQRVHRKFRGVHRGGRQFAELLRNPPRRDFARFPKVRSASRSVSTEPDAIDATHPCVLKRASTTRPFCARTESLIVSPQTGLATSAIASDQRGSRRCVDSGNVRGFFRSASARVRTGLARSNYKPDTQDSRPETCAVPLRKVYCWTIFCASISW